MKFTLDLEKDTIKNRYEFTAVLKQIACDVEQGAVSGSVKKNDGSVIGKYCLVPTE